VIGAGIKLLVRAKPVFKAQYGLSLEIDAIDSEYTLGDLEARKKEIRMRLQQEGVFDRNRRLPPQKPRTCDRSTVLGSA
jgi:exodeoxyribonuclease VII large subunit